MNNDDVFETKEFKKLRKFMGDKNAKEFVKKSPKELDEMIASATVDVQKAVDETRSNTELQRAEEKVKLFKSSLRDAVAPKKAVIAMATKLRCADKTAAPSLKAAQ